MGGEAGSFPEFLWHPGYKGHPIAREDYSLGRRGEGGLYSLIFIPASSEGRRDFCPHLALIGRVMVLVHDGYYLSA